MATPMNVPRLKVGGRPSGARPGAQLAAGHCRFTLQPEEQVPQPALAHALPRPPPCLVGFLLAAWISRQQGEGQAPCSPLTNLPLPSTELRPNLAARHLVVSLSTAGLLRD